MSANPITSKIIHIRATTNTSGISGAVISAKNNPMPASISISFMNLRVCGNLNMVLVFYSVKSVFYCPDHLLRQGCHEEFPYFWLQMAIDLFVVYRCVAFLFLAGAGFLHIEEADVLRIWYRHAHVLDRRSALERIGKSSGTLAIVCRCNLSLLSSSTSASRLR